MKGSPKRFERLWRSNDGYAVCLLGTIKAINRLAHLLWI
jgi:hypothetical protein